MNQTFPSGCEVEDYAMGRQIRLIIWSQRGSHRLFYRVRGKFSLQQTEYPVCWNYTGNTGFGLKLTRFLKQLPG